MSISVNTVWILKAQLKLNVRSTTYALKLCRWPTPHLYICRGDTTHFATTPHEHAAAGSSFTYLFFSLCFIVETPTAHGRNTVIIIGKESRCFGLRAADSVTITAGQTTWNQRLLCSQRPVAACTWQMDRVLSWQSAGLQLDKESWTVFITLVLDAQTQSQLMDSVSQVSEFLKWRCRPHYHHHRVAATHMFVCL